MKKYAFTLAEVLIAMSVIGIVAVLSIPRFIENGNQKAWNAAQKLFDKQLVEATRRMNIDGVMSGHTTTQEFLSVFKKYFKINETCAPTLLGTCFVKEFTVLNGETAETEIKETSALTTSTSIGQREWGTDTVGVVTANGYNVIMAYNPNCESIDPFTPEAQQGQVDCLAFVVDVNGNKKPNKMGQDIYVKNAQFVTIKEPLVFDCDDLNPDNTSICWIWEKYGFSTTGKSSTYSGCESYCAERNLKMATRSQIETLCNDDEDSNIIRWWTWYESTDGTNAVYYCNRWEYYAPTSQSGFGCACSSLDL